MSNLATKTGWNFYFALAWTILIIPIRLLYFTKQKEVTSGSRYIFITCFLTESLSIIIQEGNCLLYSNLFFFTSKPIRAILYSAIATILRNISTELTKQPKRRLRRLLRSKNQLSIIFNGKRVYARQKKKYGVGPVNASYLSKTMNRELCPSWIH